MVTKAGLTNSIEVVTKAGLTVHCTCIEISMNFATARNYIHVKIQCTFQDKKYIYTPNQSI